MPCRIEQFENYCNSVSHFRQYFVLKDYVIWGFYVEVTSV